MLFHPTKEMFIQSVAVIALLPAFLAGGYYLVLAFFALIPRRVNRQVESNPIHTFAIVIPAHNEEKMISNTLRSCAGVDYPRENYKIFVVADNCSDKTVELVKDSGVFCLERRDETHQGKGFALEWAFARVLPEGHDAVVVLDADCSLDRHALRVFDQYLQTGAEVLQANDSVSNPDENVISYVLAVGNLIENDLFYWPKSRLGLPVFLRGTGMVFRSDILKRYPWRAHSIVEDVEYALHLFKNGVRVKFVGEVRVLSEFPVSQHQLSVQRKRWAGGNLGFSKTHAFELILQGLIQGRPVLIDAGWTLLVLSRPLVLFELFIALGLGALSAWFSPGVFSCGLFSLGIVLVLIQGVYFGLGILLFGVTSRRMALLWKVPAVVVRLVIISLIGLVGKNQSLWARTPRV